MLVWPFSMHVLYTLLQISWIPPSRLTFFIWHTRHTSNSPFWWCKYGLTLIRWVYIYTACFFPAGCITRRCRKPFRVRWMLFPCCVFEDVQAKGLKGIETQERALRFFSVFLFFFFFCFFFKLLSCGIRAANTVWYDHWFHQSISTLRGRENEIKMGGVERREINKKNVKSVMRNLGRIFSSPSEVGGLMTVLLMPVRREIDR